MRLNYYVENNIIETTTPKPPTVWNMTLFTIFTNKHDKTLISEIILDRDTLKGIHKTIYNLCKDYNIKTDIDKVEIYQSTCCNNTYRKINGFIYENNVLVGLEKSIDEVLITTPEIMSMIFYNQISLFIDYQKDNYVKILLAKTYAEKHVIDLNYKTKLKTEYNPKIKESVPKNILLEQKYSKYETIDLEKYDLLLDNVSTYINDLWVKFSNSLKDIEQCLNKYIKKDAELYKKIDYDKKPNLFLRTNNKLIEIKYKLDTNNENYIVDIDNNKFELPAITTKLDSILLSIIKNQYRKNSKRKS